MRLGINGWRMQGQRTGVGRYVYNVLRHWTRESSRRFDEITLYTSQLLDRRETQLSEHVRERVLTPDCRLLLWENLLLAPIARDDVLFCPSFTRPLVTRSKTVVAIHDAIPKLHPELFPLSSRLLYNRLYGWSAHHATLVVTDSQAAKQDIARAWGVPASKIRVTYLASEEQFKPELEPRRVHEVRYRYVGGDLPFFLFVGKISGRRSIPVLLAAFSELKHRTSLPHRLLLVGLNPHNVELAKLALQLEITEHVKYCGYIPDSDLNLLYNAADIFVMPSIYESSSLPVMEAQAAGVPVLCLDTPGMREITGGAALLVSRLEIPLLFESMARMAADAALRREISERGLANARRFSWQRCSAETLDVLEEASHL